MMKVYRVFFTTITIEYKIFSDLEPFFLAHTRNLTPLSRLKMSSQPNSSRLLDLPREIRDMIYEYALTEDQGLLLVEHDDTQKSFRGCRPTDPGTKSNCLKYVCRQLYYETKGLDLGLNDLTIRSEFGEQTEDFITFLGTCSVGQQQCIRKVTLCTKWNSFSGSEKK